ncbi:hypothetical protein ACLOJK_029336, partial [Asimina triloba]
MVESSLKNHGGREFLLCIKKGPSDGVPVYNTLRRKIWSEEQKKKTTKKRDPLPMPSGGVLPIDRLFVADVFYLD